MLLYLQNEILTVQKESIVFSYADDMLQNCKVIVKQKVYYAK